MWNSDIFEYAINEYGDVVHVDDVENGAACNCTCPACGEELIAKNGGYIQAHHFAHKSGESCSWAAESSLHCMAKQVLAEGCYIYLPAVHFDGGVNFERIRPGDELFDGGWASRPAIEFTTLRYNIAPFMLIKPDRVRLEKRIDRFIPDVIATYGGRDLIIEIYVSHKVDHAKIQKIRKAGISAIEIDLSDAGEYICRQQLKDIISSGEHTKWLVNTVAEKKAAEWIRTRQGKTNYKKLYHMSGGQLGVYSPCCATPFYSKNGTPVIPVSKCIGCRYNVEYNVGYGQECYVKCNRKPFSEDRWPVDFGKDSKWAFGEIVRDYMTENTPYPIP